MPAAEKERPRNQGYDHVELTGHKVRLRSTSAADAPRAYGLVRGNQQILKWLFWKGPQSQEELAETLGTKWPLEMQSGTRYPFAIEEAEQPGLIGVIDARIERYPRQLEAGYWLGVPYWHRGYMPEALELLCYFCFKHLKAEVMLSGAFTGNTASRRVMEKAGFTFEGTLRRFLCQDDRWIDLWHMSLLREEWEARKFKPVSEKVTKH